jgi:hypothetical protein
MKYIRAHQFSAKVSKNNSDGVPPGGGTFDVSLLIFDNGVFEVLATNGDTHLGWCLPSLFLLQKIFF